MRSGALHRRLSRLEGHRVEAPCPGECGRIQFVMYDEYDRPMNEPGRCPVCGGVYVHRFEIHLVQPKPLPPGAPPVGARWPVGGAAPQEVAVGGEPPAPPDRPTGATRAE